MVLIACGDRGVPTYNMFYLLGVTMMLACNSVAFNAVWTYAFFPDSWWICFLFATIFMSMAYSTALFGGHWFLFRDGPVQSKFIYLGGIVACAVVTCVFSIITAVKAESATVFGGFFFAVLFHIVNGLILQFFYKDDRETYACGQIVRERNFLWYLLGACVWWTLSALPTLIGSGTHALIIFTLIMAIVVGLVGMVCGHWYLLKENAPPLVGAIYFLCCCMTVVYMLICLLLVALLNDVGDLAIPRGIVVQMCSCGVAFHALNAVCLRLYASAQGTGGLLQELKSTQRIA